VVRSAVQRIHFGKNDLPVFVDDKYRPLADPREWRPFTHDPEGLGHGRMGIKIRTHGEMHRSDGMLLPSDVAVDGISAYVQDLGIERGELLAIRVERRQLFPSSRSPVQRMKSHQNIFFAAEIAELDFCPLLTFDCWQLEIGSSITNL
jgi:hypothetical protein